MQSYRERRRLIGRDVTIHHDEGRMRGSLRDATSKGFRIAADLEAEVGDEIEILFEEWRVEGTVVWARGGEFGVELRGVGLARGRLDRLVGQRRLDRSSRVGFRDV